MLTDSKTQILILLKGSSESNLPLSGLVQALTSYRQIWTHNALNWLIVIIKATTGHFTNQNTKLARVCSPRLQ